MPSQAVQATEGIPLVSTGRTATTVTPTLENFSGHRGVIIFFNVTGGTFTNGLTLKVEARDPASGTWGQIHDNLTAVTATGLKTYVIHPEVTALANSTNGYAKVVSGVIPKFWRITVTHGDSGTFTYSVGVVFVG